MEIWPTSHLPGRWDVVTSVDLAGATVRVMVNDVWYPATWVSTSTPVGSNFTRTCKLDFAGVDGGSGALVTEDDEPRVEVTVGTTVLVAKSTKRVVVKP